MYIYIYIYIFIYLYTLIIIKTTNIRIVYLSLNVLHVSSDQNKANIKNFSKNHKKVYIMTFQIRLNNFS